MYSATITDIRTTFGGGLMRNTPRVVFHHVIYTLGSHDQGQAVVDLE